MTRHRPVVLLLLLGLAPLLLVAPPRAEAADGAQDHGRLLLVLDSSGSMKEPAAGGTTKIVAARSALDEVVGRLPADTDVGLRVFGARVFSRSRPGACTDSQLVVRPGVGNRPALTRAIASYRPYGETPIGYALRQAAGDLGSEGNRSIVLVSDGEATCAPDPCRVAGQIAASGIDLKIDVVGLDVSGAARRQLRCIADKGNGTYYDARSAAEIASSLQRVASRAARPFTVSGRPVTGGTRADPTPLAVGDWSDTLPGATASPRTTLYYVVERKRRGTTLRVSVVSPGQKQEWDGVRVDITPLAGPSTSTCDTAIDWRTSLTVIGTEAVAGSQYGCDAPGRYLVAVSRYLSAPARIPIGIRVTEEPALRRPVQPDLGDRATYAAPRVAGPARTVTAGSSFNDATTLGTGRWSSTIVPGEAQMYRVPLAFGQGLRLRVHFPDDAAERRLAIGFGMGTFVHVRLYNPMRGALQDAEDAHFTGTTDQDLTDALAPVSRSRAGTDGADLSMAGSYYVSLVASTRDQTPELPYTVDLEVTGSAGHAPAYAAGGTWSADAAVDQVVARAGGGPTPASGPTASASASATPSASTDSATSRPPTDGTVGSAVKLGAAGVLVLVALVCGGLGVRLLRRSRAG